MTILYADDDADDCELLTEALELIDPSIECKTANDGREVLKILREQHFMPDYIFLDVNMPVMDGKDCLETLKGDEQLKNIPVVIYSTTRDSGEIRELYAMGAEEFIQKPNNFNALCDTLKDVIGRLQTNAA